MSASTGGPASPDATPSPQRVPALLVMHADLAEALLRAASRIYGPIEDLVVISNEGLSRIDLERNIVAAAGRWPAGGLVFTDFWGGSCHTSGIATARACQDVVILTGVNLPLLLDYLHNRDHTDVETLAERLQVKGRESIRVQHGPPA